MLNKLFYSVGGLFGGKGLYGHSMFVKTSLIKNIVNWDSLIMAYDHVLTISSLIEGEVVHVNIPLTIWRRHNETVTTSMINHLDTENSSEQLKNEKLIPLVLIIRVFANLIRNNKVPNFSWYYANYNLVCLNFSHNIKSENISKFAYWYSKECILGLLMASYYHVKIEKVKGINKLKSFYRPIHYYYQCMTVHYETFRSWH